MNKSWKAFIIIISSMLAVIIVCTTINVSIGKVTAGISSQQGGTGNGYNADSGVNNGTYGNDGTVIQGNVPAGTDAANGDANQQTPSGGNNQSGLNNTGNTAGNNKPSGSASTGAPSANGGSPLSYDKAQLVNYYNQCLRKTYSQPKFTVQKTEVVDVQLGQMMIDGKPADKIQDLANSVVERNKKKGGTETQSFTSQTAAVDAKKRFILPSNMYPAAVRSASVSQNGQGYVIKFTLNEENCDFRTRPPYNSSCTFPLDFNEIDLGNIGQITSAQFNYPGTTLTATIDGQGRVVKTYVEMPLYVKNAAGQGMGKTLTMDISGRWLCTNINTF